MTKFSINHVFDVSRDSCVTKISDISSNGVSKFNVYWVPMTDRPNTNTQAHIHILWTLSFFLPLCLSISLLSLFLSLSSLFFYLFLSTLFSFLSLFLCLYSLFFSLISVFHTHTLSFINITRFLVSERRRRLALKLVKKILALSERW